MGERNGNWRCAKEEDELKMGVGEGRREEGRRGTREGSKRRGERWMRRLGEGCEVRGGWGG